MHKRMSTRSPNTREDVGLDAKRLGDEAPATARRARELAQGVAAEEQFEAGLTNIPH